MTEEIRTNKSSEEYGQKLKCTDTCKRQLKAKKTMPSCKSRYQIDKRSKHKDGTDTQGGESESETKVKCQMDRIVTHDEKKDWGKEDTPVGRKDYTRLDGGNEKTNVRMRKEYNSDVITNGNNNKGCGEKVGSVKEDDRGLEGTKKQKNEENTKYRSKILRQKKERDYAQIKKPVRNAPGKLKSNNKAKESKEATVFELVQNKVYSSPMTLTEPCARTFEDTSLCLSLPLIDQEKAFDKVKPSKKILCDRVIIGDFDMAQKAYQTKNESNNPLGHSVNSENNCDSLKMPDKAAFDKDNCNIMQTVDNTSTCDSLCHSRQQDIPEPLPHTVGSPWVERSRDRQSVKTYTTEIKAEPDTLMSLNVNSNSESEDVSHSNNVAEPCEVCCDMDDKNLNNKDILADASDQTQATVSLETISLCADARETHGLRSRDLPVLTACDVIEAGQVEAKGSGHVSAQGGLSGDHQKYSKVWSHAKHDGQRIKGVSFHDNDTKKAGLSIDPVKNMKNYISRTRIGRMRRKKKQKKRRERKSRQIFVRKIWRKSNWRSLKVTGSDTYRRHGDSNNQNTKQQQRRSNTTRAGGRMNRRGGTGQTSSSQSGGGDNSGDNDDNEDDDRKHPRQMSAQLTGGHYIETAGEKQEEKPRGIQTTTEQLQTKRSPQDEMKVKVGDRTGEHSGGLGMENEEESIGHGASMMMRGSSHVIPGTTHTIHSHDHDWSNSEQEKEDMSVLDSSENPPSSISVFHKQVHNRTNRRDNDSGIVDTSDHHSDIDNNNAIPSISERHFLPAGSLYRNQPLTRDNSHESSVTQSPDSGLPRSVSNTSGKLSDPQFSDFESPMQSPVGDETSKNGVPELKCSPESNSRTIESCKTGKTSSESKAGVINSDELKPSTFRLHGDTIDKTNIGSRSVPMLDKDILSDICDDKSQMATTSKDVDVFFVSDSGFRKRSGQHHLKTSISSGTGVKEKGDGIPCDLMPRGIGDKLKPQSLTGDSSHGQGIPINDPSDLQASHPSISSSCAIETGSKVMMTDQQTKKENTLVHICHSEEEGVDAFGLPTVNEQLETRNQLASSDTEGQTKVNDEKLCPSGNDPNLVQTLVFTQSQPGYQDYNRMTGTGSHRVTRRRGLDYALPVVEEDDDLEEDTEGDENMNGSDNEPKHHARADSEAKVKDKADDSGAKVKDKADDSGAKVKDKAGDREGTVRRKHSPRVGLESGRGLDSREEQAESRSGPGGAHVDLHPSADERRTQDKPDGQDGQAHDVDILVEEARVTKVLTGRETDQFRSVMKEMCSILSNFCVGLRQKSSGLVPVLLSLVKHFVGCKTELDSCDRCKTVLKIWKDHHDHLSTPSSSGQLKYRQPSCQIKICQKRRKRQLTTEKVREKSFSLGGVSSTVSLNCSTSMDVQKLKLFFLEQLRDREEVSTMEMQQLNRQLLDRDRTFLRQDSNRHSDAVRLQSRSGARFAAGETVPHPRVMSLRGSDPIPAQMPPVSSLTSLLGEDPQYESGHFASFQNIGESAGLNDREKEEEEEEGMDFLEGGSIIEDPPTTSLTLDLMIDSQGPGSSVQENRGDVVGALVTYGTVQDLNFKAAVWMQYSEAYENQGQLFGSHQAEGYILEDYREMFRVGEDCLYEEEDHYNMVVFLGAGVSGRCYLAKDIESQRTFCIKIVDLIKFDSDEMMIWLELNHPNVVKLYGVLRKQEYIFFFSEYIEGTTLKDAILQQKGLNVHLSLHYMRDILLALCHLEEVGVVHEDLKADNIMLRNSGNRMICVIIDFGVSKKLDEFARFVENENPIGAPTHWSPEKARSHRYTHNADTWAAFCNLIHMLAGEEPWVRRYGEISQLLLAIGDCTVPPVDDLPMNTDPRVRKFIEYGMDVNPDQRPSPRQLLQHPIWQMIGYTPEGIPTVVPTDENSNSVESLERTPSLTPEQNRRIAEGYLPIFIDQYRQSRSEEVIFEKQQQTAREGSDPQMRGSIRNQPHVDQLPTPILGMEVSGGNEDADHSPSSGNNNNCDVQYGLYTSSGHGGLNRSTQDNTNDERLAEANSSGVQNPPAQEYVSRPPTHGDIVPSESLFNSLSTDRHPSESVDEEFDRYNSILMHSPSYKSTPLELFNKTEPTNMGVESKELEGQNVDILNEIKPTEYDDFEILPDLSAFDDTASRISQSDASDLANENPLFIGQGQHVTGSNNRDQTGFSHNRFSRASSRVSESRASDALPDIEEERLSLQGAAAIIRTPRQTVSNPGELRTGEPRLWVRGRGDECMDDIDTEMQIQIMNSLSKNGTPPPPNAGSTSAQTHSSLYQGGGDASSENISTSKCQNSVGRQSSSGSSGRSGQNSREPPRTLDWQNGFQPTRTNPTTTANPLTDGSNATGQSQGSVFSPPEKFDVSRNVREPSQTFDIPRNIQNTLGRQEKPLGNGSFQIPQKSRVEHKPPSSKHPHEGFQMNVGDGDWQLPRRENVDIAQRPDQLFLPDYQQNNGANFPTAHDQVGPRSQLPHTSTPKVLGSHGSKYKNSKALSKNQFESPKRNTTTLTTRRCSSPSVLPGSGTFRNIPPTSQDELMDQSFQTAPSGYSTPPPGRRRFSAETLGLSPPYNNTKSSPARTDERERSGSTAESPYTAWQAEELERRVSECEEFEQSRLFQEISLNSAPEEVTERFQRSMSGSYHTANEGASCNNRYGNDSFWLNRSMSSSNSSSGVKVEFCTSEGKVLVTFRLNSQESEVTWGEAVTRSSHMLQEDNNIDEYTVFHESGQQFPLDLYEPIPTSSRLIQVIVHPLQPGDRFRWKVVAGKIVLHSSYSPHFPH